MPERDRDGDAKQHEKCISAYVIATSPVKQGKALNKFSKKSQLVPVD